MEVGPGHEPLFSRVVFGHLDIVTAGGGVELSSFGSVGFLLAVGDVELTGRCENMIIISAGSVHLKNDLDRSLVIAKGNITVEKVPVNDSRLISGGSVITKLKTLPRCEVAENEPNPLGYIRWSDTPKGEPTKK